MAKKKIEVEVSKETHDVGVLVADIVKGLIEKKPLAELAAGELEALKNAVDGITDLPGEVGEDPGAFALAIAIPISSILTAAVKKAQASEAPSA